MGICKIINTDREGSRINYKAMIKRKQIKVSRERAITIAMNHNCISKECARIIYDKADWRSLTCTIY